VRWGLLSVPLERDEGEYAYAGQLILEGEPPYRSVFNMKWPGTYAAYAAIMATFGQSVEGIRLGLIFVNGLGILAAFLIGCELAGDVAAIVAAAAFAVGSLLSNIHGIMANAEHFALVPVMFGCWSILKCRASLWPFWPAVAGVLLGLGPVMKQQAIAF